MLVSYLGAMQSKAKFVILSCFLPHLTIHTKTFNKSRQASESIQKLDRETKGDIENNFFYLRSLLTKTDDRNFHVENSFFWAILTIFDHLEFSPENPARSQTQLHMCH